MHTRQSSLTYGRILYFALAVLVFSGCTFLPASAQTLTTLHTFGTKPVANIQPDAWPETRQAICTVKLNREEHSPAAQSSSSLLQQRAGNGPKP